jgi:hypothetical protein
VQRHDDAAENVADQEADDGGHGFGTEHHGQGAVDHRRDLHVGTEPEGELAGGRAVALALRNHVDGSALDGARGTQRCCINTHEIAPSIPLDVSYMSEQLSVISIKLSIRIL